MLYTKNNGIIRRRKEERGKSHKCLVKRSIANCLVMESLIGESETDDVVSRLRYGTARNIFGVKLSRAVEGRGYTHHKVNNKLSDSQLPFF